MDIRKLQRAIVDGLEDVKGQNIVVFNTEALSPLFERVIIASGTSNRQTKALASSVRDAVKKRGLRVLRTEGEDNGEWIIVDCGAAVAHIMQPAIRDYYHLEEIWGGKPVAMKLGDSAPKALPKAEEAPAEAAPAKKARSSKAPASASAAPARKARPAKKAAPSRAPASAKPAPKPARQAAPKAGTRTPAKTAAKTASGRSAPRKAPARKRAG